MNTLRFHRKALAYFATHQYIVWNASPGNWQIEVRNLTTTAGVQHAVGQPAVARSYGEKKAEAVNIAQEFSNLGDDFREADHGHQTRMTVASNRVNDRIIQKIKEG